MTTKSSTGVFLLVGFVFLIAGLSNGSAPLIVLAMAYMALGLSKKLFPKGANSKT